MAKEKSHAWGDYYYQHSRPKGKTKWVLDMINHINESIPSFNDLFDEESFYVFVFFVVLATIAFAVILSRVVGVTIKEHDIHINREWRDARPANFFHFPWKEKKE